MLDIRKYLLVSDQIEYAELAVIIRELVSALKNTSSGSVVELGCYTGTTSLFIQRAMDELHVQRPFHVYDSFSGLPEKVGKDMSPAGEQFKAGELTASKQALIKHFRQAGLQTPIIHRKWFEELEAGDIPAAVAFAFLDGDFYTSIKSSLEIITPALAPGAIIVVDDYQSEALPGARRAADEWAKKHGQSIRSEQSLGIIHYVSR